MELRDIEIFLTLAEELHFGRTAARLHVSVARVSQAIKKQERGIGAELFLRDSRNVQLTPAGAQLRMDLAPIYRGLQKSLERARLAAQGKTDVLRIGMIPGNAYDLRHYWETFRTRHPQWGLRIRHAPFYEPFAGLRRGDMDILVAWLPVLEPDLVTGPSLFTDTRLLAVGLDHELAGRSSAVLEMLGDYPHAAVPDLPAYWSDAYTPPHTPKGRNIVRGPRVETTDDIFGLITAGEAVIPFPAHVRRFWARPDVSWLPIPDMHSLTYGLVWRGETETDLIRAFAAVVRDLGGFRQDAPEV
ncbi:LysR family transcriptional regulator [Streptomyces gardneri]|uniref:LysR family transcriptional regulator n=1 Tax=Streptomyces gardneri TaxID=66892 RepID=A0A4Y3RLS7_9ACTN|nr:LysR family transcriptional regulator [Streptomyces gardneri]GEB58595.1 LysR family transcriptional regulator [Streptomyces gardneri]GHG82989.1 LysR family transcriptional regulator [Streptomyces gardneri]